MSRSTKIILLLIGLSIFCLSLIILRYEFWQGQTIEWTPLSKIVSQRGVYYMFLIWNLILAWIPFLLARMVLIVPFRPFQIAGLILWLLFLPNAPYILTDLMHLRPRANIPLYFDLIMIVSYAWTGLLLGFLSLIDVQQWISKVTGKNLDQLLALTIIPLCALGVYLGRFLRWNSWEVFTQPQIILNDTVELLKDTEQLNTMLCLVIPFSMLLYLIYLPFKILIHEKPID